MSVTLRAIGPSDLDDLARICCLAFGPVHDGFRDALGERLFDLDFPNWQAGYADMLRGWAYSDPASVALLAASRGAPVGVILARLRPGSAMAEITLLAVSPDHQRHGIGRRLLDAATERLAALGARAVTVATGGDAAHAPARQFYAAASFDRVIPSLHLYRELDP